MLTRALASQPDPARGRSSSVGLRARVPTPREAASRIQVVATTTDLKALTEAVGGDLVEVDALARGNQNPHDLEVRPSLMVKVRRADLLVDERPRARPVGRGRRAGRGQRARGARRAGPRRRLRRAARARGAADARSTARWATCTRSATRTTRSIPAWPPGVTANILEGLARVAPQSRPVFERNRQAFLGAAWTRRSPGGPRPWRRSRAPRWWSTTTSGSTSSLASASSRRARSRSGPASRPRPRT